MTVDTSDLGIRASIDIHAHCVPAELIDVMRADGRRLGVEVAEDGTGTTVLLDGRRRVGPLRRDLIDMSLRLETMERTGVDVQVLSSFIDLTGYELEPRAGAAFARRFNEAIAAEAEEHAGRFMMLATVPLQDGELAAAELEHAVTKLGAVGVEIATTVDGNALVDARLDSFWAMAESLRCIVLVHPHLPLAGLDLTDKMLHNMVGRPLETTIAVARLMVAGVLDRHPELRICLVHGGGALPFQVGRLQRGYEALPHLVATEMQNAPIELLGRMYFDTVLFSPSGIRYLIDFAGADHVVLGSDYPFPMGDPDPLATVDAIPGLTGAERDAIVGGNVLRLISEIERPNAGR